MRLEYSLAATESVGKFRRRNRSPLLTFKRGLILLIAIATGLAPSEAASQDYRIGTARIDITPDYPVRLSGFGFRRTESEGITQRIWAKALAFSRDDEKPAILLTVDNLGIPASMVATVAQRLHAIFEIDPERLTITATHTHTAPMLSAVAPTLFGLPIPAEHQARIDQYTQTLVTQLEEVAAAAIRNRQPGTLEFGIGKAGFAINRRTKGGPVDHDLPTLIARDDAGKIIAIYTNYACHCVTLSHNQISGDWAGYAQSAIEARFPGCNAMLAIGCGADSNPSSGVVGDDTKTAAQQGDQIADGINKVLKGPRLKVTGPISIQSKTIPLDFAPLPTRDEWLEKANRSDAIGYHARVNLNRIESNESLQTTLDYRIQTWTFGSSMAWVFLPGEVVVDYSLRLKRELDESKVWITAYANDAPCYIPSERILQEGGYEGGGAMVYYDRPTKLASGLEQQIVDTVHSLLPDRFRPPSGTDGIAPKSPRESLQCFQTHPQLAVQLVAAEPLIIDPVAIDWDLKGNLWVAEMHDYPLGMRGGYEPGGRIKKLTDRDGDGTYDHATLFADNLPFPTGLKATEQGIIIGAAPNILLAKDTDADGRADHIETLFSGFADHNYQARVNSFTWGLDHWIYAANGLFGGQITTPDQPNNPIDTRRRDLRFQLSDRTLETVSGLTQQGRVRDDWGNWFGCQNGVLINHYPLEQHYLSRTPVLETPPAHAIHWLDQDPGRLFPISRPMARFNDPSHQGRVTSACGIGIYRDTLLGHEYYGNAFTCEPVHNLVRRIVLEPSGGTFAAKRANTETQQDFLTSTDLWFRPAQATSGPDGALWIVDMYRFLMEHPIWIRPDRLTELDPRAGDQMGRIYRIVNRKAQHPNAALPAYTSSEWPGLLDQGNGPLRDLAHQAMVENQATELAPDVQRTSQQSPNAAARAQALCVLDGLNVLEPQSIIRAMKDPAPGVRQQAIRLAEQLDSHPPELWTALAQRVHDPSPHVRRQLAYSVGNLSHPTSPKILAALLSREQDAPYIEIAALSSAKPHLQSLVELFWQDSIVHYSERQWAGFLSLAEDSHNPALQQAIAKALLSAKANLSISSRFRLISKSWMDSEPYHRQASIARQKLTQPDSDVSQSVAATQLLGREASNEIADIQVLASALKSTHDARLAEACIQGLSRIGTPDAFNHLRAAYPTLGPKARDRIASAFLQHPAWTRRWLQSIAISTQSLSLSPTQRDRLLNHSDAEIQTLAREYLNRGTTESKQARIVYFSAAASLTGKPERGRAHFELRCATCHALHGVGRALGPDLRELSDRSPQHLITEIIDPNRVSLDSYRSFEIEQNDDTLLAGLIVDESTERVTLKGADGVSHNIPRRNIRQIRATGRSLMPEELDEGMTPSDMADLIAFINQPTSTTPPPRDPATIAAYISDPARSPEQRSRTLEVHYALADRLIPHLEQGPDAEEILHHLGVITGKRNEASTLPRIFKRLLAQSETLLGETSLALLAGLFQGWNGAGSPPHVALDRWLKVSDQVKLWNATRPAPDQLSNPSPNRFHQTVQSERPFPGTASVWKGFVRFDFEFDSRNAIVVLPRQPLPRKPWIWRARFFGHEPQLDIALLEKGYHLVYLDVSNLFGSPSAIAHWDRFYEFLVRHKQFHPKAFLEGMSRGGLMIYRWANAHPDQVAGIYADAPVLDFKSWPGGPRRKTHRGQQQAWEALRHAYHFSTDSEALAYQGNPIDTAHRMARHRIPLFHISGDSDIVVPYAENTGRFKDRYHQAGGALFREIVKPHIGHHPHSIPDPQPLVEFVESCYQNIH